MIYGYYFLFFKILHADINLHKFKKIWGKSTQLIIIIYYAAY